MAVMPQSPELLSKQWDKRINMCMFVADHCCPNAPAEPKACKKKLQQTLRAVRMPAALQSRSRTFTRARVAHVT